MLKAGSASAGRPAAFPWDQTGCEEQQGALCPGGETVFMEAGERTRGRQSPDTEKGAGESPGRLSSPDGGLPGARG